MYLGQLNIEIANIQDLAAVIECVSNDPPPPVVREAVMPLVLKNVMTNSLAPNWNDWIFPKRNFFVPLNNIDVSDVNEVNLVYIDDNRSSEGAFVPVAYDVIVQFVYAEEQELTYEEKVADFDKKNEAITMLLN